MNISFSEQAWEEYLYWQSIDPSVVTKINSLLNAIAQNPFEGIGRPEALTYGLKGFWSRWITDDHQLVYRIYNAKTVNQECEVVQCRYHYKK